MNTPNNKSAIQSITISIESTNQSIKYLNTQAINQSSSQAELEAIHKLIDQLNESTITSNSD
jgi:hypothetical protein